MTAPLVPADYPAWLADLKTRIRETRLRAALAVNSELIGLYWRIGRDILERQAEQGWGSKIVDRLAADLRAEFPDARGFSSANLRYMKSFAEAWPDPAILQRLVGKLPWGQNIELLAVKDSDARLWYAEAVLENGWSRPVLATQIDTNAHGRHGKALTNFSRTLPPETSDLAQQVLKDPYQFDFLTLRGAAHERDVERALDDLEREPEDSPSIGLILCREHNRVVVEYALRNVDTPIGVARYQLLPPETLPEGLAGALPTQDELEPGMLPADEADDE